MLSKKQISDVKKVMSIETEMIRFLPLLDEDILNPWGKELTKVLKNLKLKPNQVVLDLPCGKGGVSISLAKKFGVKVFGFDLLSSYVKSANLRAKKENVECLCDFKIADIRTVVKKKNSCDLLLWIAPPHLWKTAKETVKALRNQVKSGGLILIADAYLDQEKGKKLYPEYQPISQINKDLCSFGDKVVKCYNYKNKL